MERMPCSPPLLRLTNVPWKEVEWDQYCRLRDVLHRIIQQHRGGRFALLELERTGRRIRVEVVHYNGPYERNTRIGFYPERPTVMRSRIGAVHYEVNSGFYICDGAAYVELYTYECAGADIPFVLYAEDTGERIFQGFMRGIKCTGTIFDAMDMRWMTRP